MNQFTEIDTIPLPVLEAMVERIIAAEKNDHWSVEVFTLDPEHGELSWDVDGYALCQDADFIVTRTSDGAEVGHPMLSSNTFPRKKIQAEIERRKTLFEASE